MSTQINFYHTHFRKKYLLLPFSRILLISSLATLSIPMMIAFNHIELQKIETQATQIQNEYNSMQSKWMKIQGALAQKNPDQKLAAQVAKLEIILAHSSDLTRLIKNNHFDHANGYSDYLIALARQHIANIWLTKINITNNGSSLNLEGKTHDAITLPNYLQRLSKEPVLNGTQLETLRIKHDPSDRSSRSPLHFIVATASEEE